jgi:hypothetical protein
LHLCLRTVDDAPAAAFVEQLFAACLALQERGLRYDLDVARPEAVMLRLVLPGEYWEIEFFADGTIERERFVSQGVEECPTAIEAVLRALDS